MDTKGHLKKYVRLTCLVNMILLKNILWISFPFLPGALSRTHYNIERKSWKPADYPGVWLLWWMSAEVWKCQCVEIFHRSIWLSSSYSFSRWTGVCVCLDFVGEDLTWGERLWLITWGWHLYELFLCFFGFSVFFFNYNIINRPYGTAE